MSAGSVSSNHSAVIEQSDLGWKEGHILKGLKRLQMCRSKEAASHASVPHCKDCMTSNEGIYSLGVICGLQGAPVKQAATASKTFKTEEGIATLDSDDADDDSPKLQSGENSNQPTKEQLCLDKLDVTKDNDGNFLEDTVKLAGNSGLFPSPVTDNFLFLEGTTVKPAISPIDSLTHRQEKNKDSLEKQKATGIKFSDRNNNQERSTDRKSRLDQVKKQQGKLQAKQMEAGTSDVGSAIIHSATRALSCVNEARQRSSSAEVPHCRDQASQAVGQSQHYTISESPKRKLKPQPFDSARKAFILRSKSADGGPEQAKHTHSPLHQKLIKSHRSKGQSNPTEHSAPSKTTNLSKTHGSSKGALSKVEKDEDIVVSTTSKSLESVQQRSPLASPVKYSKTFKPPGVNESSKSPTKSSLQIDQHCDVSHLEPSSSPVPQPPGRTTSLLLRPSSDSLPPGQVQSSTTGKITSNTSMTKDKQPTAPQMGAEGKPLKDASSKLHHTHSTKITSVPVQESHASDSSQLFMDRTATFHENGTPSVLPNQSILRRSQQSISEPKLSEVLLQAYSNVYYQGASSNSNSGASKTALPMNAKSNEAIAGQETNTFVIFGRQNKDEANSATKPVQTFQTFTCDAQVTHEGGVQGRRKIETRCNSLDSEPCAQPVASDSGVMLDWGFDEEGWLFKRSVSVSTRPLLKPVMGMNGAKARSQSFGARYMDRPSFRKVRTQIKTHSGSSLNSLGDALPGSMSCSSSYHCPMNRSLLNNFLIEEGLTVPSHLGSSSERLQSLKLQREQARRLQIEQQFSSAFGEPVSEEPERQSTITTIEEKVMLGIEENLHKSQEQERTTEVKQKSGSTLANWFGFRKSKLPAPNGKKSDPPKVKDDKREQKITSLLGGKQAKSDKKRDRRKSDGKDW